MKLRSSRKTTIAHIAEACGVSKMTVSRAIRNDPSVSEATRQLVLRVAERERYLPTGYGIGKNENKPVSRHYYALFHREVALQDAFFGEIVRTIQGELFLRGMNCSVGIIEDDYSEFVKLYEMLQTGSAAGLFVVGPASSRWVNALLERFTDVVLVDNPGGPDLQRPCSAVFCENAFGAHQAVQHLAGLGRRRILLAIGPSGNYFSENLMSGYEKALADCDIEYDPALVVRGDFHVEGGREAVTSALNAGLDFDAVFTNDEMAFGAMKAVTEAGLSIPDDVAVVGFDNLPIGMAVTPALTTVAVDREQMGRRAVGLLLRLGRENASAEVSERIGLLPRLLIRESCGWKKLHGSA